MSDESELRFTVKYGPPPKPLVLISAKRLADDLLRRSIEGESDPEGRKPIGVFNAEDYDSETTGHGLDAPKA